MSPDKTNKGNHYNVYYGRERISAEFSVKQNDGNTICPKKENK